MPDDFSAQLASHDAILRHLVALNVKMVEAIARIDVSIERLTTNLEVVTALLQRQRDDEHRHGS